MQQCVQGECAGEGRAAGSTPIQQWVCRRTVLPRGNATMSYQTVELKSISLCGMLVLLVWGGAQRLAALGYKEEDRHAQTKLPCWDW